MYFEYQKSRTHLKRILYNDLPKAFLKSLIRNEVKPCCLKLDGTGYKLSDILVPIQDIKVKLLRVYVVGTY